MTPLEKQEFENLKKQVEDLRTLLDPRFLGYAKTRLPFLEKGAEVTVADSDVDRNVSIPDGGGTDDVLDYPDKWIIVRFKGTPYLLGLYNYSRI